MKGIVEISYVISVCLYLSICLSVYLYICIYTCMYVCIYISTYMYTYMATCIFSGKVTLSLDWLLWLVKLPTDRLRSWQDRNGEEGVCAAALNSAVPIWTGILARFLHATWHATQFRGGADQGTTERHARIEYPQLVRNADVSRAQLPR